MNKTQAGLSRAVLAAAALMFLPPAAAASNGKSMAPIPADTVAIIRAKGSAPSAPILIRAFKKESELEVWKLARDGRYVHVKTFPVCRWSGQLGPKRTMGDRQTPEGFYAIGPGQMNPNSSFHLSFDVGYPNAFDQAHGGTGAYLMVHGNCSSAGCFAMTDKGISEIYALVREAFSGGQRAFQFQSYPFRMTAENMAKHRLDPNIGFWRQLKEGWDRFEATKEEPAVGVSLGRYVFASASDPEKEAAVKAHRAEEEARIAALVAQGKPAVRTTYADGGQHASFRAAAKRRGHSLGTVSRPETLALAGQEVLLGPNGAPIAKACTPGSDCPGQSAKTKSAAADTKQAKVRRVSQTRPAAPPAEQPPAPAADPSFQERFLGYFRNEPARETNSGRRI